MDISVRHRYDIGVIVGRFQISSLHPAHKKVLDTVNSNHKTFIILVGITDGTLGNRDNPLGYVQRKQMLETEYPNAIISYIQDRPDDKDWSTGLDKTIRCLCPVGSVCLYGGRDSFIKHYKGNYNTFELDTYSDYSGTDSRKEVGTESINSIDFRKGIIYATQNRYNLIYPCVDIAIIKKESKKVYTFLGKRKENSLWRFPGGFVDHNDNTYEQAALREMTEEIGMEVDKDAITYICSSYIEDKRYNGVDEKIMTILYAVPYVFGSYSPKDIEFIETDWIEVSSKNLNMIEKNHRPLFQSLDQTLSKHKKKPKDEDIEYDE